jgi:mono/diheme cytochrome c family protein
MFGNLLIWLVIVVLAIAFAWLAVRAWRARSAAAKWGGVIGAGLLSLVMALLAVVSARGLIRLYLPYGHAAPDLQVAGTPEQVARGQHLAASFCASCHSATGELPLTGGVDLFADIPIPLGSARSANLTPAGRLANYTDGQIFRVLREGVDKDGKPLILMGVVRVRHMSDEDIHAVIAFLRSQPAVANDVPLPLDQPNFLAAIMGGAGMLPPRQPPVQGPIVAPPAAETVEFGEYNVSFQDCRDCHGADLHGGVEGQLAPIGPNIAAMVKDWTREDFITTLRTGVDPTGHQLSEAMPWRQIGLLDDTELGAIYLYLKSLP